MPAVSVSCGNVARDKSSARAKLRGGNVIGVLQHLAVNIEIKMRLTD
jgi:hypothetical protein